MSTFDQGEYLQYYLPVTGEIDGNFSPPEDRGKPTCDRREASSYPRLYQGLVEGCTRSFSQQLSKNLHREGFLQLRDIRQQVTAEQ